MDVELARHGLARRVALRAPLPFSSPQLVTAMLWHRRLDDVPAHRWLRDLVLCAARLA